MSKKAKIYYINIGGEHKTVKAYSKKDISSNLNMNMYQINIDCEIFTSEEYEGEIDIDLTNEKPTFHFDLDFISALKSCIDGNNIQNINDPENYFIKFNGRGFEDCLGSELDTYDFCDLENKWRALL